MDLGSEISQKFKASIKRKLKDCGTYIDDELPEYIMVMIANKRQQYQMKDDLSLFLGEETDNFVAWLFQMLEKLQSATQDEPTEDNQSKTLAKESNINLQIDPKSIETGAIVIKSEPPDSEVEIEQLENVEIDNIEQTVVAEECSNKRPAVENIEKHSEIEERRDSGDKGMRKVEKDRNKVDKVMNKEEEEKSQESYRRKHRKRQKSPSPSNITIVASEEDKRHERTERERSKIRKLSTSPSWSKEKVEYSDEETSTEPPKQISSKITIQKIRPSLPRSRQATGLLIQRAIKEANQSVTTIPRKRSESQEQIEAIPSLLEASTERRVQLKRSKAKDPVGEAATSRAFEKEARESGDEAHTSVTVSKKRKVGAQDDGIEVEVADNEFQEEEETEEKGRSDRRTVILHRTYDRKQETGSETRVNNKSNRKEEEKRTVQEDVNIKRVENETEEQKVQIVNSEDYKEKSKLKHDKDEKYRRERRRHRNKREKSNHKEKRRNSPQFVVTLHGGSHEQASDKRQRRYHSSRRAHSSSEDDSIFIDLNPNKPMEILESAQKEIDKMALKLDLMQNVLPPSNIDPISSFLTNSSISLPPLSGTITSITTPAFQETLPIIPGELNTRILPNSIYARQHSIAGVLPVPSPVIVMQNALEQRRSPRARSSSREVIVSVGSEGKEDANEDQDIVEDEEEQSDTFLMRCKFWPNCRNEGCSYVHPTKPCRMFPNCNFKDKCIFLHPMCKFDKRCANLTCPYTHTSKQRVPMTFAPKARVKHEAFMDPLTPICKFIPNCSRTNCQFRHPVTKPCRFGSGCKRGDCPFHHETRPASGGALKWSNNASNSPKHISERSFAASVEEVTIIPISVTTR